MHGTLNRTSRKLSESTKESRNEDVFRPFAASTPVKVNARSVYDLYDGDSDASSSVGTPIKRLHAEQSWVDLNDTDSDVEFAGSPVCSLSGPHMENQPFSPKIKFGFISTTALQAQTMSFHQKSTSKINNKDSWS